MDPISNPQTAPAPAPSAAPNADELQAKLAELEKQSEGRLRDLQEERRKRQELESRLAAPAPSPVQQDVNSDELGKVLNPYIAPVAKIAQDAQKELEEMRMEKAQRFLMDKTGKSWDQIESDNDLQNKLLQVTRRFGISGNVYDKTVRAYELMELEALRAKEVERVRAAQAAQTTSLPAGIPPAPASAGKEYSVEEFKRMPVREFDVLSKEGSFRKVGDKFVYVKNT